MRVSFPATAVTTPLAPTLSHNLTNRETKRLFAVNLSVNFLDANADRVKGHLHSDESVFPRHSS